MRLWEIVKINNIDCLESQSKSRLFHWKIQKTRVDTMHIIHYLLRRNNALASEKSDEIYLLKVAIDVMRHISTLSWNQKFFSLVIILIDEIVKSSIYHFLWFSIAIECTCVDHVHSSWSNRIYHCSKHLVVMLVAGRAIIRTYS